MIRLYAGVALDAHKGEEDQMLNRTTVTVIWTAAVLALGTVAVAETPGVSERFTFVAANGSKTGPSGEGRMQIVINQWSPDAERDRLLSVLKEGGSDKLAEAFRVGPFAGYINLPGNLQYTIRFAYRMSRADGGEDVILATDYPVHLWWDPALGAAPTSFAHGTVIQLQLNRDGRGEGKLSVGTKLSATKDGKLFALEDYAKQPVVLTDVRRERTT
jgi:hypothetical protein